MAFIFCTLSLLLAGCKPAPTKWQGYNEGRFTYVSVNYPGILQQLFVERGTAVKKDQPLFILEPQPQSEELQQAESDLVSAQDAVEKATADLALAQLTYNRDKTLVPKNAIQQSVLDAALDDLIRTKSALAQANADLVAKKAKLNQSKWVLSQKTVNSPKDAIVFDTYFRTGELVQVGQSVLSLLASPDVKTIFFVPETEVAKIHLGQKVWIQCDGCKSDINGKIVFISPQVEYTPPVIYSNETRSKLVFHIEAVPEQIEDASKMHPGQPVTVEPK
ncbi:MAG: HlyD family secretion protein [Gammaproteobacteria bacterium]